MAKAISKTHRGTYATAIALATIGATVSLSGLVAMFGLMFLPIGAGLEVAKLVAARRLHQGGVTGAHRVALISLVAVCMAVTTVGVYGFISRGYAERVATMTRSTDHALVEAGERVKLVEQNLDGIEHQITKLDAPETRTVKIKTAGRTTETVTPVAKDKTARATLEARRTQTAAELADLRVEVAGKQADRANVERELNTVRAIAQVVGLGNDPALAVNVLAGTLATLWDPFAVLLLLAATRQAPPAEKAKPTVRKSKSGRSDLPVKQKPTRKAPAKLKVANDNVVPFKPAA